MPPDAPLSEVPRSLLSGVVEMHAHALARRPRDRAGREFAQRSILVGAVAVSLARSSFHYIAAESER